MLQIKVVLSIFLVKSVTCLAGKSTCMFVFCCFQSFTICRVTNIGTINIGQNCIMSKHLATERSQLTMLSYS